MRSPAGAGSIRQLRKPSDCATGFRRLRTGTLRSPVSLFGRLEKLAKSYHCIVMTRLCIQFSKRSKDCDRARAARRKSIAGMKRPARHARKLLQTVPAGRYIHRPVGTARLGTMVELAANTISPARERILEAAERVVGEVGAARMTLDGVAQAAGVSKGGLLYHFPSKESLLSALAKRYVESMADCVEQAKNATGETGDRDLKACILGILEQQPRAKIVGMGAALFAAAANDLTLLEVIRERIAQYTKQLERSDVDFARAAVVTLAIDGLIMRESLRISCFTEEQRERVVQQLLKIADEAYR
ncbi:TetR/AcrR family transcriptional regulator [Steroidobacter sp. S1-65]|uniref:TetR/AcrR family transcriptional regulator n=1 Tax=Steroidobacter gossypii TaxID=2805490 RepID=A0ABS1X6J3_9GAMM|nr:TetR/AcrR family transcriptional regulator [Steroidobacter gossypii]MBM0108833.1 TetR/AcrR family transcriptional regulator [Steroidobacter gossypii]